MCKDTFYLQAHLGPTVRSPTVSCLGYLAYAFLVVLSGICQAAQTTSKYWCVLHSLWALHGTKINIGKCSTEHPLCKQIQGTRSRSSLLLLLLLCDCACCIAGSTRGRFRSLGSLKVPQQGKCSSSSSRIVAAFYAAWSSASSKAHNNRRTAACWSRLNGG